MTDEAPWILEKDARNLQGVLLSDEIKRYSHDYKLIEPFDEQHLAPASYDFTIGRKYRREGIEHVLDEGHPLVIPPHESVVVSTKERLRMPRFLVGRWNLRVSLVYKGLVWVGGVHVDPGWVGELWCPLYNLSKDTVVLQYTDTFASIDFEITTAFSSDCKKYEEGKGRAPPYHPGSGLEELRNDIAEFPKRLEQYQSTNFLVMAIMFSAIAIIVAALSVIAVQPTDARVFQIPGTNFAGAAFGIGTFASTLGLELAILRVVDQRRQESVVVRRRQDEIARKEEDLAMNKAHLNELKRIGKEADKLREQEAKELHRQEKSREGPK